MARKTTNTRKNFKGSRTQNTMEGYSGTSSVKGPSDISGISGGEWNTDKRGFVMNVVSNPAFKYVMGGIATAVLTKLVTNMADKYPELSNFIRENLDTIEEKLGEFRSHMDETSDQARYS